MITFLCIILVSWLTLGACLAGRRTPGYCHWRHTISELGASGAPHEQATRFALFLPTGLMAALIAMLFLQNSNAAAASLAAFIAVGYLSASIFPVDEGAPLHGTRANFWHNLGGMLMYFGGGVSLIAAHQQTPAFTMAGGLSLVGLAGLSPNTPARYRGRIQRLVEMIFFGALVGHSLSGFA